MLMTKELLIEAVNDQASAEETACLASEIWHQHYDSIIGRDQVNYMLETFQSSAAILRDINEKGYDYFLVKNNSGYLGYYAVCLERDTSSLFLSKIYVSNQARGRGLARIMLDHMIKRNKPDSIWLTVNKNNCRSIAVYEHFGFRTERTQKVDIGSGYFMDDLVMRLQLNR